MEISNNAIQSVLEVLSGVLLITLLTWTIIRISRYLRRKLKVTIIDFSVGFLVGVLLLKNNFRSLFLFLSETFNKILFLINNFQRINEGSLEYYEGNYISSFIANEGFLRVLVLIISFFILSYLISLIRIKYEIGVDKTQIDDKDLIKKDILLRNTVTAIIISLSIYLCISTLIAVSYFQDERSDKEDVVKQLENAINEYSKSDDNVLVSYKQEIEEKVSLIRNDSDLVDIKGLLNYSNKVIKWLELNFNQHDQYKSVILNKLEEINQQKVNYTYKTKFKNDFIEQYYRYRNQWEKVNNDYYESFTRVIGDWRRSSPEEKQDPLYFSWQNDVYLFPRVYSNYINKPDLEDDVFNSIAGWLIDSLSYQFIIIAGLIGFGFLGAAVSTLVRQKKDDESNELLLADLLGVIVRGFTAALIIFLAVKGGLSILVKDAVELNAYALFFTCFASAVYSENAWAWAKNRLLANLETLQNRTNTVSSTTRGQNLKQEDVFKKINEKLQPQVERFKKEKANSIFKILESKLNQK